MKRILALVLPFLSLAVPVTGYAWGSEGHAVVVQVALRLMTDRQKKEVYALLGTHDWQKIGAWADRVRPFRPDSEEHWHYVDIPKDAEAYDSARDCSPTCIIQGLNRAQATLKNKQASDTERKEALLFWFHLVADLHQPFHCYNNNDRGGNSLIVLFHGKRCTMHKLWDSKLIETQNPNAWSLSSQIWRHHRYPSTIPSFIEAANTSHARAREALLAPNTRVGYKYIRHEWTVITRSLWEAAGMAATIGPDLVRSGD